MISSDQLFMQEALQEARKAFDENEVPVGAVLVHEGVIVARAHNLVETLCDATAHAELLCMRAASAYLGAWRLTEAILYSTLEPCAMCAGAMISARISTLVWGAPDKRQGAHGSWVNILDHKHPIHQLTIRKQVLEEECALLMREFFLTKRKEKAGCGRTI